ncbi:MAG TPA: nucleotide excision repair endonuclease [Verrucomicrobiae bacterium]
MTQMLLIPDPRPLVGRLGADFFRQAPQAPGVYLMRDAAGEVLYVGKAKNLRNRLRNYRVANPDRMPRRHLRLLRTAVRIDLRECSDESTALATESELLRSLRPRFNRAGTWPGVPRFLVWRATDLEFDLGVTTTIEPGWRSYGPLGVSAWYLRAALARLVWCVLQPERGLAGLPAGWSRGAQGEIVTIPCCPSACADLAQIETALSALFVGRPADFLAWICQHTPTQSHPFESIMREADLEFLAPFLKGKVAAPDSDTSEKPSAPEVAIEDSSSRGACPMTLILEY